MDDNDGESGSTASRRNKGRTTRKTNHDDTSDGAGVSETGAATAITKRLRSTPSRRPKKHAATNSGPPKRHSRVADGLFKRGQALTDGLGGRLRRGIMNNRDEAEDQSPKNRQRVLLATAG